MSAAAVAPEVSELDARLAKISLSKPVSTPEDYTNYAFQLPHERYVGLLACQIDPNLRELETLVVRCKERSNDSEALVTRSNGKEKGKQKAKAPVRQQERLWEVELLDTALFPEGGGQASDTGSLVLLDEPNAPHIQVKEVIRRHLSAVHLCTAPVPVNSRVLVNVDWARRHDLCTQHTAQHLLSAVLEHHFDCPTVGWALSSFPNLSYVELPRCPTREELTETERICNDLIVEGRRVRVEMELSQDDNRPDTLPADYVGGVVRTVVIDDLDRNPCCGTHYPTLAPIQALHVSLFTTPVRGTNTRVYFLAGPRVTQQLSTSLASMRAAGQELSCTAEDVAPRTKALLESSKEGARMSKRLKEELAEFVAGSILQKAKAASTVNDCALLHALLREEESTNDLDFLLAVQNKLKDALASESGARYAFALAQTGNGTTFPNGCLLIFASEDAVAAKVAEYIRKGETDLTRRLKGGGKGRWQGKLSEGRFRKSDEAELMDLLRRSM